MIGERERTPSRYLYINNMETVADSGGGQKRDPEYNPADSLACSGLRARLRLGQRLLRSKDGNGLWWAELSCEILTEGSREI